MRERIRRGRRRALACALALGLAPVVGLPTGPAAALQPLFEPEPLPFAEAGETGLRQRRRIGRPLGRGGCRLRAAAPTSVSVPLAVAVAVPLAVAAAPARRL